jgi:rhodanese-related sulfurtransferase
VNPHFVGQVKKVASMHRPVVLICRSGHRSVDAGLALEEAGFKDVYNVAEGFEGPLDDDHHRGTLGGWRKEGLPWEQL